MAETGAEAERLALAGGEALVTWRRSKRARRVSLRIDPRGGGVVITLPLRASRGAGMALLQGHAGWIAARLAALPEVVAFSDGAAVPVGGLPHRIRHCPEERGGAWIADGEIIVTGEAGFIARRVRDLLIREARARLLALATAKAARLTHKGDRALRRVTIKDTSSRWGSCASDGSLAFSWRLVMAPGFVLDYVAAHEVAHLRHMNHAKPFWALVRELTPHTDAAIAWLHQHGPALLRAG
jgi:predicted metal-dependent hydrolase